ncbi:MAG TPA: MlaD family protein [Rhodanobacteraceae bacterium]|nr:MlaD family protein [Rhodanobacteraceae bacterium]
METRAHHVLIGAFTILVFVCALGFVLWLSKSSIDQEFAYYDVIFNEAVTGLSKGGLVQYNGIKVGEVTQLKLAPDDPRKVIARVRIDAGTPIRQDTRAKLGLLGVTGVAFIQLSGGAPGSPPLLPSPANPVPVIRSEESALSKLLGSGADIVTSANDVLFRIGQLVSRENVDRVSDTLQHLDELTGTVAAQRDDLAIALKQLADASGQLKTTLTTLDTMATTTNDLMRNNARAVLEQTQKALEAVDKVAESTNALINDNRSAISHFSNQGLRQVGPAMVDLRATLRSLRQLADQLAQSNSLLLGRDRPQEFHPEHRP